MNRESFSMQNTLHHIIIIHQCVAVHLCECVVLSTRLCVCLANLRRTIWIFLLFHIAARLGGLIIHNANFKQSHTCDRMRAVCVAAFYRSSFICMSINDIQSHENTAATRKPSRVRLSAVGYKFKTIELIDWQNRGALAHGGYERRIDYKKSRVPL